MILPLLLTALFVSPTQLVKKGDAASHALRDFERIVHQHLRAGDPWPTLDQAREIHFKLDVAHETVRDSLLLGLDLGPAGISPQALSLLRAQQGAIVALAALTSGAPKDAQKAMTHVVQRFNMLFALFPTVAPDTDHPPPRSNGLDGRGRTARGKAVPVPLAKRTRMSVWCECVHPQPEWNGHTQRSMLVCQLCGYRSRPAES